MNHYYVKNFPKRKGKMPNREMYNLAKRVSKCLIYKLTYIFQKKEDM